MTISFRIFVNALFLASNLFTASTASCVEADDTCVDIFNGVKPNILNVNITEDGGLEKRRFNCEGFRNCTPSLKCNGEPDLIQTIDDVNSYCDAILFRHSPGFEACDDKLIERNSTCINEWIPYPETVEDPILNDEILKKFCGQYFGKDGCLEKEMSEACGVDVWEGFKKNQLAMNKIAGTCKFD